MIAEKQTTNKELSKKMKNLGFPQDSFFFWYEMGSESFLNIPDDIDYSRASELCSAYTLSELGELIKKYKDHLKNVDLQEMGCAGEEDIAECNFNPDFLARILINLKEKKLI